MNLMSGGARGKGHMSSVLFSHSTQPHGPRSAHQKVGLEQLQPLLRPRQLLRGVAAGTAGGRGVSRVNRMSRSEP